MLQLLHEGKFVEPISREIAENVAWRAPELLTQLEALERVVDFSDFTQVSQVGGKAFGLHLAEKIIDEETIIPSRVIPVRAVNQWLSTIPHMQDALRNLEFAISTQDRMAWAAEIEAAILTAEPPRELLDNFIRSISNDPGARLVFRSSSFDEDVDVIGPAPGVYESVVDVSVRDTRAVGDAFKTVVASFFSGKAVAFRDMKGLRHQPVMAVLGQRFIEGPGGTMFVDGERTTINIASSPAAINDLGREEVVSHDVAHGDVIEDADWVDDLRRCGRCAHRILGPVDVEFVHGSEGLTILQLRRLERPPVPVVAKDLGRLATLTVAQLSELDVEEQTGPIRLDMHDMENLDTFQGDVIKEILTHSRIVASVIIPENLPPTSHLVNILMTLGITVEGQKS